MVTGVPLVRLVFLFFSFTSLVWPQSSTSGFRFQREQVAGGAELVTVFAKHNDPRVGADNLDVPLLSVLRDTLGDQDRDTDRLRYVWILTSTRPTVWQRAASAISIFRFRAGTKTHAGAVPSPVLDLASPSKTVWPNLLANTLQSTRVDPLGMLVRSSTRSYRGNSSDYRKIQVFQTLGALDALERDAEGQGLLSDAEVREIYSRLSLSDRTLGGLVRQKNLARFYDKENTRLEQTRGHNWELLRQRAELNGLYFQPLALPDSSPSHALLWVSSDDLNRREDQHFDKQFLNIANPWTDDRLLHWRGYSETRYLNSDNALVSADSPEARPVEMIPLALFSLDYPRAPMLLADFRNSLTPKRRELVRNGASTVFTSVLGISRFGNWPFFAAESTWNFVRGRHGAAVDRSARLRAYSGAREFLALDTGLNSTLRKELLARLDHLALNPLENGISAEAKVAQGQYTALLRYAKSNDGLGAKLDRDRRSELRSYTESKIHRMFASLIGSKTNIDFNLEADLGAYRRTAYHVRFLEHVLASSPEPEVDWNPIQIRESVNALAQDSKGPRLIAEIFARSNDFTIRMACLRALQHNGSDVARAELQRLAQDSRTPESWRTLFETTGAVSASSPGEQ